MAGRPGFPPPEPPQSFSKPNPFARAVKVQLGKAGKSKKSRKNTRKAAAMKFLKMGNMGGGMMNGGM